MTLRAMLQPAIVPVYLTTGARMIRRAIRGPRRFPGDAAAVCRAIVDGCWTGEYLAASAGHFRQFWTRDLGFAALSLVRVGAGERLRASLAWALETWAARGGRVTTTIFPGRRPADVFRFGVDSLPLLLHALHAAEADDLVRAHAAWLEREVARYGHEVLDPSSGLVRDDRVFATHRDTVRTRGNAYSNSMVVLLDRVLRQTGWFASPVPTGASERSRDAFWRVDHLVESRADPPDALLTGDANVVPFFVGALPAEAGLGPALRAVARAGLASPLPLRYVTRRDPTLEDPVQRLFAPDYQGTAIWTSLGLMYLSLLRSVDPPAAAGGIAAYTRLVERDGTLWEVLDGHDPRLVPYTGRGRLFRSDEAMLWSVILLELLEEHW